MLGEVNRDLRDLWHCVFLKKVEFNREWWRASCIDHEDCLACSCRKLAARTRSKCLNLTDCHDGPNASNLDGLSF